MEILIILFDNFKLYVMKLKLILNVFVLSVFVFSFAACSDIFSLDFTKQESVDKVREKLAAEISENAIVVGLSFGSDNEGFSADMNYAMLLFVEEEGAEVKSKRISLGGGETRDWKTPFTKAKLTVEDGVKLSEIDFSKIAANIQKAKDIFESDSVGLSFSGIGGYDIKMNKDPQKIIHKFSLQSKGDTKMTTTSNGRLATETEYYELNFEADSEGEVKLLD